MQMNVFSFFLHGLGIGTAVAAPPGPISILTVKASIESGMRSAAMVILGSGLVHVIYSSIAALSLHQIVPLLQASSCAYLGKVGAAVLLLHLAYCELMRLQNGERTQVIANQSMLGYLVYTIGLTLTNPMTILSMMSLFASMPVHPATMYEIGYLVSGVCSGSLLWRLFLVTVSLRCRQAIITRYIKHFRVLAAMSLTYYAGCALLA